MASNTALLSYHINMQLPVPQFLIPKQLDKKKWAHYQPPFTMHPPVRTFRGKKPIYFPFLLWIFILQCIFLNILQKLHLGDPRWVLSLSRTLKQIIILKSKWLLWELCRETRICFNPQSSSASIAEVTSTSRNHSELGECAWCSLPKNGRLRRECVLIYSLYITSKEANHSQYDLMSYP